MTPPTYADLIRELFPRLTGGIRWGLDRTERLLASVGDPQRSFPSLHVGGTNGKGSVCATLASVLRHAGGRVGLYTSPHLCAFRERIQLNGQPLPDERLLASAARLWPAFEVERPSFFEATTALAFLALAEAGADVVVAEVGLGGRLDATNVLRPEVAVLTNVAMDHAQHLGNTREAIAGEKAGIIKSGIPVVTAERDPAILALFRARAEEVGAPLVALAADEPSAVRNVNGATAFELRSSAWGPLALRTSLAGAHQAVNAALAVRALELLPPDLLPAREAVERGVADVRWPGRLQHEIVNGRQWLFDVAHNPAGVDALVAALPGLGLPRPLIALVGILGDKDWSRMLPPLAAAVDGVILTEPPTAPAERRWDAAAVLARLPGGSAARAEAERDFRAALERARGRAGSGTVLVTSSFHTVGDALALLGRAPAGVDPPLQPPSAAV